MSRSPGRIIAVAAALLLGLGGIFTLVRYVQTSEDRALAGQELVEVFVVKDQIPAGTPATELIAYVEAKRVPVAVRGQDAVTSIESLGSLTNEVDLLPGEQILESRFSLDSSRTVAGGQLVIPDGLLEVTIQTTAERAVGGQIIPGQVVGVIGSFDGIDSVTNEEETIAVTSPQTHLLVRKALVSNVQASTPELFEPELDQERSREAPTVDLLVTLAVEPAQAERLVFASEYGSVWFVSEPELAPEDATEIVSYDSIFINVTGAEGADSPNPEEADPAPETLASAAEEEPADNTPEQPEPETEPDEANPEPSQTEDEG